MANEPIMPAPPCKAFDVTFYFLKTHLHKIIYNPCYIISYPGLFDIHQGKPGDHPFTWYTDHEDDLQVPLQYKDLIDLGLHLYGGGYHEFNLLRSLSHWSFSPDIVNVFFQALAVRKGWEMEQAL